MSGLSDIVGGAQAGANLALNFYNTKKSNERADRSMQLREEAAAQSTQLNQLNVDRVKRDMAKAQDLDAADTLEAWADFQEGKEVDKTRTVKAMNHLWRPELENGVPEGTTTRIADTLLSNNGKGMYFDLDVADRGMSPYRAPYTVDRSREPNAPVQEFPMAESFAKADDLDKSVRAQYGLPSTISTKDVVNFLRTKAGDPQVKAGKLLAAKYAREDQLATTKQKNAIELQGVKQKDAIKLEGIKGSAKIKAAAARAGASTKEGDWKFDETSSGDMLMTNKKGEVKKYNEAVGDFVHPTYGATYEKIAELHPEFSRSKVDQLIKAASPDVWQHNQYSSQYDKATEDKPSTKSGSTWDKAAKSINGIDLSADLDAKKLFDAGDRDGFNNYVSGKLGNQQSEKPTGERPTNPAETPNHPHVQKAESLLADINKQINETSNRKTASLNDRFARREGLNKLQERKNKIESVLADVKKYRDPNQRYYVRGLSRDGKILQEKALKELDALLTEGKQ